MPQDIQRCRSIDILRGADMFFLCGGAALLFSLLQLVYGGSVPPALSAAFQHAAWGAGFTCWDLVMPLFIFICGCSMPFAFASYQAKGGDAWRWRTAWRILRRVVLLFVLGMVVQGHLLSFRASEISLFCNTLQAIAEGYLIAGVAMLFCRWRGLLFSCLLLLAGYWALLRFMPYGGHAGGAFEPHDNLAYFIDCTLQGPLQDGTPYTWILTALSFGALTLMGSLAGSCIRRFAGLRAAGLLTAAGVLCLGAALLLEHDTPLIKHLFTTTMVLWAGGWCLLLLALFHLLFDRVPGAAALGFPLTIIGSNALLAYLLTNIPGLAGHSLWGSLTTPLFGGFASCFAPSELVLNLCSFLGLWLLLLLLYRKRVFLRV